MTLTAAGPAGAVETAAPRILMVDSSTSRSVLIQRRSGEVFAPGNFAKLMTLAVVLDALDQGEIAETTPFPVSEHAWRSGGAPAGVTTMFARIKSEIPVSDLLRGLVVDHANDAAIILAEGLSGSEQVFAGRMNELAIRIGMSDSRFANPTGFASPSARITMADLALLCDWIWTRHPDANTLFSAPDFTWNGITQRNKTTPVRNVPGVLGMMLAWDQRAGYGAAILAERGDRRIVLVMNGLGSEKARDDEVTALVDAAFDEFWPVALFPPGATVGEVSVFRGAVERIPVKAQNGASAVLPVSDDADVSAAVVYEGPVSAPVEAGQEIASLEISVAGENVASVPLVAGADVSEGTFSQKAGDGLYQLLFGWW
ncbi:D-alanyl-D-alanine carboxypeptidase family protein [Hartmannibacter diazotrophicus]|uniref:D-alanyl-D-alanine carboxypeptidase family protein n=1 Tax=Hartmannibacter diazotrophicus TaxID=1482074 RepID=UPI00139032D6|nr:D-alanyl-D-alanine carboxypeptidase family protein [Hartmannibacter diazotrophicus]